MNTNSSKYLIEYNKFEDRVVFSISDYKDYFFLLSYFNDELIKKISYNGKLIKLCSFFIQSGNPNNYWCLEEKEIADYINTRELLNKIIEKFEKKNEIEICEMALNFESDICISIDETRFSLVFFAERQFEYIGIINKFMNYSFPKISQLLFDNIISSAINNANKIIEINNSGHITNMFENLEEYRKS
ncbi:MAG: hypothetical protein V4608_04090 [Bacteroidota bacterium]